MMGKMPSFHRIVVATPHLEWEIPIDMDLGEIRVRFDRSTKGVDTSSTIQHQYGDVIEITQVPLESHLKREDDSSWVRYDGNVLEVIAQGKTNDVAEQRCRAVLGLFTLCYGNNIRGKTLFSEKYVGDPSKKFERVSAFVTSEYPHSLPNVHQVLVACVPQVLAKGSGLDSIGVALRWYDHAMIQAAPEDKIVANFIGIERILRSWAQQQSVESQFASLVNNEHLIEVVREALLSEGVEAVRSFMNSLVRPSIDECYRAYAQKHLLDERWKSIFDKARRVRNATVHASGRIRASESDVIFVQSLLRTIIKKELGITGRLPSEILPGTLPARVEWSETEGWVQIGEFDIFEFLKLSRE